jgi:hypothetical protein
MEVGKIFFNKKCGKLFYYRVINNPFVENLYLNLGADDSFRRIDGGKLPFPQWKKY